MYRFAARLTCSVQPEHPMGRHHADRRDAGRGILCCRQERVAVMHRLESRFYRNIPVAVKIWKSHVGSEEKRYLDREVNIQKRLDHPNCLKLYGVTTNPQGYPVMVTELADCTLTALTTKRKETHRPKLSNEEKKKYILEIAEGIEYIHSLGFIHRDIKVMSVSAV